MPRRKASDTQSIPVDSTRHKDKRKNIPTRELQDFVKDDEAATARTFRVPAVNNHGGFGRWAFAEIRDPWYAGKTIRDAVAALSPGSNV